MAEVRLSASALRDLRSIRLIGRRDHGAAASDAHMSGFDRLFGVLRDTPLAGQRRPEFRQPIRSLSHRPHRILYQVEGGSVLIVRIVHQARDVRLALREEH